MKNTKIDVLMIEAGIKPCKVSIGCDYKTIKYLVNPCLNLLSDVEAIMLEKDVALLYNKEGALLGLKGNRKVGETIITGTFFVVGVNNGKVASLTKEMQEKYYKRFEKIEKYEDKEVSNAYWDFCFSSLDDD